ncbi:hypothetical protein [Algoriphagus sediminis]|uniref:Uncharacterized protein n=1 Tax=Algoriphagus sediminis TaxID=3057113 RepID=A0ABT7YDM5_9BACT|nr:hypothetical protein [Algoriphagus sediminis]MDN3204597.1 hypothetical protein [Algoriphagus sediminis]
MKTLMTLALAGAISFSSLANDNNDDLMELSAVKARYKTVNVLLKEGVGEAKIAIMDENGKKLHQRKVKQKGSDIIIPYNMEDMPCGEYQVEITTDDERVLYTVSTFNRSIPVEELPLMAYGKKLDDNTVNLAVIGLMEPGVDVKIRYKNNDRVLHSETIDTPEGFRKDYYLEGVDADEIYFELHDALGRTKYIHM